MKLPTLVLLPGLDGTGALFERLLQMLPKDVLVGPVAYPESLERLDRCVEHAQATPLHRVFTVQI